MSMPIPIQAELRSAGFGVGVYAIYHQKSGKSYVGSSKNIPKRIGEHFNKLRTHSHHSPIFQNYWNKYGEESFIVARLEICSEDELLKIEQIFLDCMGELNGSKFATPGKMPNSNETKKKKSESARGKSKPSKGKTYLEIYGTESPACGFKKGKPLSAETYEKLSQSTSRLWAEGKLKGFKKSEETKAKMSASRKLYWERKRNANSGKVS